MSKKENKVKSWSLSALSQYEECPRKYYELRIAKSVKPKPSMALEKGIHFHSVAEQYLLGKITGMPRELSKFAKEFKALKKHNAIPEEEWVLDKSWEPVENTKEQKAWFSKDAWLRAKGDARVDNLIIDFKTGRHYESHADQAKLYANILMSIDPTNEVVDVEFWYLTNGDVKSYEFTILDLDADVEEWNQRVDKLFSETEWAPKRTDWCHTCEARFGCPLFEKKT